MTIRTQCILYLLIKTQAVTQPDHKEYMNITVIFFPFHIYISLLQAYKLISILPKDPRCEVCMAETGSVVPVKDFFSRMCHCNITVA